jgi:hypothetical protein
VSELNEWETFKSFPWWGKIVALVAGAPIIGLAIMFAPIWIPWLAWGWWLDRKDSKNSPPWARDS